MEGKQIVIRSVSIRHPDPPIRNLPDFELHLQIIIQLFISQFVDVCDVTLIFVVFG